MTEWMPKPPVKATKISARYYHLEPGDATRYEFVVHLHPTEMGCMVISGVGGATFGTTYVRVDELLEYLAKHPNWNDQKQCISSRIVHAEVDPFLTYLKMTTGYYSHMTGLAAVMAMKAFLDDEALL